MLPFELVSYCGLSLFGTEKKMMASWEPFQGEIKTLFPVRIYSQKEDFRIG